MVTCFRHEVLFKARSRMTTAFAFSRQHDAGSRRALLRIKTDLVRVVVLVLEPKGLHCCRKKRFQPKIPFCPWSAEERIAGSVLLARPTLQAKLLEA